MLAIRAVHKRNANVNRDVAMAFVEYFYIPPQAISEMSKKVGNIISCFEALVSKL